MNINPIAVPTYYPSYIFNGVINSHVTVKIPRNFYVRPR